MGPLYLATALCGVYFLYLVKAHFFGMINIRAFFGQVERLVMANNIERAIKLCNAEIDAIAPRSLNQLLVVADREISIDLYYEVALTRLDKERKKNWPLYVILIAGFVALGIGLGAKGGEGLFTSAAAVLLVAASWRLHSKWNKHLRTTATCLAALRVLLFNRCRWHPPHYQPHKKLTDEEYRAWKSKLEDIHAKAMSEGTTPEKVYEEVADPEIPPPHGLPALDL